MIFDAGSSHTEMLVYKWQADKFQGTGVVSQVASCEMAGGVGEVLRANPGANATDYFRGCVSKGLDVIPLDRRAHSPVYLAATAGMRIVRTESPESAQQILGNVSRALERLAGGDRGLLFGVNSVRIISGQEEAVAGWISANYLLRTIFPKPTKMVGMLDMGGASTQITFLRDKDPASSSVFDTSLRLYGARHELYARSYMCFGQTEAYRRYLVLLVQDFWNSTEPSSKLTEIAVSSPCDHAGFTATYDFQDYVNVCSQTQSTDAYRNVTVKIVGESNPVECQRRIRSLLNTSHCHKTFTNGDCFSEPLTHSSDTNFVAVAGFYYVMTYLDFTKSNPSVKEFQSAVESRCNKTWQDIKAAQTGIREDYLSRVCFNAKYNEDLLFNGYGIKDETWRNIAFLKKVNGTSMGWTLGFTIRSTNAFPEERAFEPFSATTFTSGIFILSFCVGVCLTLVIMLSVRSHCRSNQIGIQ